MNPIQSALGKARIQWKKAGGQEIEADVRGTGHYSFKINLESGKWFSTDGDKGGAAKLLRILALGDFLPRAMPRQEKPKAKRNVALRVWNDAKKVIFADPHRRKAVREYLASRLGKKHLAHWVRQVRIGVPHQQYDLDQIRAGAVAVMIVAAQDERGDIVALQRTYLDQNGRKVAGFIAPTGEWHPSLPDGIEETQAREWREAAGRKMVGAWTEAPTTPIPVPDGVFPANLGVDMAPIDGEGFETVAALVQAVGWPGSACHTANSLAKVAARRRQTGSVFAVDRDESETGQIWTAKAVRIVRENGGKAYYAIPPVHEHGGPKGGHKGSDWGDYPKEGISSDVLVAHLALAIAHGDQEMLEIDDEPGMVIMPKPVQIHAWRPAVNPQAPAPSGPTHEVRANMQTSLQKTVSDYLAWLKDKDTPFNPVLMMPTTGTGKSTAAKALTRHVDLRMQGGRVCVFVPDHAQAGEYADEGFFHFYGRNPEPTHCGYCPNYQTAQEAMEKGHISQAEVCRQCSNGYRWVIDYYGEIEAEKAQERVEEAKAKLRARGLDWRKVTPCVWQSHLRDALAALFVIAVFGSYSHSLTRDSLVIFDEHFKAGKGVNVTLQDVDHWARRNQAIVEYLEAPGRDPDALALARHRQAGEFFRAVAVAMAGWVGKTGAISVDAALLEAIQGILEASRKSRKDDVDLAGWETLKFNQAGEMSDNPLRAAHAIAESLRFGDGYVSDGRLIVAHSLPVMERLADGQPTVILDATPDPVIVDVVQAQGGQIINAITHQNVRIVRYPTRFWGLTPLNIKRAGAKRVEREVMKYSKLIDHHHREYGEMSFLFHKKAFDALDLGNHRRNHEGEPVAYEGFPHIKLGDFDYWGRGHRAHNRWKGKELVIVGSFFPPMETWRGEYQVSRIAALSAGANPENWPAWQDGMEMVENEWICEGHHDVQSRLPLPADQHIREWLLARITAETVQAIGRARGANAESTIDVHIYGGVPLHGLWQHGLSVASYEADPECLGQTKAEHIQDMQAERDAGLAKVDMLAARVISKGQTVTRQALESEALEMAATGTDGPQTPAVIGLCQGGYNIHTTPAQTKTAPRQIFTMPHERVVQEWFATRAPMLAAHLSTTGRNARVVRAAQAAAQRFGEAMVQAALQMADFLFKSTGGDADRLADIAWQTIEYGGNVSDMELVAARLVLDVLGRTEGVPPPW